MKNAPQEMIPPAEKGPASKGFLHSMESPCKTCSESPCCQYLPLRSFEVRNLMELDHARYLLNFDFIELGIGSKGKWHVYYRYPCRYLDLDTKNCTVHNQPEQPAVCKNYNPYQCWYKRALPQNMSDEFIRLDRVRLDHISKLLQFDERGTIVAIPEWDVLQAEVGKLPIAMPPEIPARTDNPMFEQWRSVIKGEIDPPEQVSKSFAELQDPCSGCAAHCCKNLIFPQNRPQTISNLDFFIFALGFPGVELGITDGEWSLIVKTHCRHLKDNRCSIFGQDERPLVCRYYDALKCDYKAQFGLPKTKGFLKVQLDTYRQQILPQISFDEFGNVVVMASVEEFQQVIEESFLQA